jgi:hypothetical protein
MLWLDIECPLNDDSQLKKLVNGSNKRTNRYDKKGKLQIVDLLFFAFFLTRLYNM